MLRANLKRIPERRSPRQRRGHRRHPDQQGRVRVSFLTGCAAASTACRPATCWAATAPTARYAPAIGAHMYGLPFQQTWVVIDVDTDAELNQWEGCHQLCNPQRAGTYMRVGRPATAGNSGCSTAKPPPTTRASPTIEPLIAPWLGDTPADALSWCASPPTPSARRWPTAGATAMCSSWVTPPTSPRRSSARAWQPGCATR